MLFATSYSVVDAKCAPYLKKAINCCSKENECFQTQNHLSCQPEVNILFLTSKLRRINVTRVKNNSFLMCEFMRYRELNN